MSRMQTDMRETVEAARRIRYEPTAPLVATDVQEAIEALQVEILTPPAFPPAIVPTQITFANSPYTALPNDYLILVDTSGGAVTIVLPLAATRANLPVEIKDSSGNASANNISVNRTGGDTIDGLTTYPIASDFDAKTFKPKAAGGYTVI